MSEYKSLCAFLPPTIVLVYVPVLGSDSGLGGPWPFTNLQPAWTDRHKVILNVLGVNGRRMFPLK